MQNVSGAVNQGQDLRRKYLTGIYEQKSLKTIWDSNRNRPKDSHLTWPWISHPQTINKSATMRSPRFLELCKQQLFAFLLKCCVEKIVCVCVCVCAGEWKRGCLIEGTPLGNFLQRGISHFRSAWLLFRLEAWFSSMAGVWGEGVFGRDFWRV